ncbi:hypothetical protein BACCIP111895_01654 [Neobacillus rhizosphaerae]|uniref:HTH marR-type domain-containing protein n=1 Tax=Neobacillus rhizosphaerae TaxID=2880965 RepID=A0ABM9EPE3_9BACI|nr:winged helix DNA-binding protein [Neobacillus rhizosphaerae]CAH2714491.1 hypothetical protein BACCIP111895_01654 [Neobacillus rhizosphaerae]
MGQREQEQFIFANIFLLANKLQLIGDSLMEETTLKQWFLLIMIKTMQKEQPSISEISDFTGNTRQNTKKMLENLARKGYVTIEKSTVDNRALCVSLTEKCFEYFVVNEKSGNEFLDKVFKNIDKEKLTIVIEFFEQLFQNIDKFNGSKEVKYD